MERKTTETEKRISNKKYTDIMNMKRMSALLFALLLMAGGGSEVAAQKWLRKLGKALDTAAEIVGVQTGDVSVPGFDIKVGECKHWGTGAVLNLTVQNTSSGDQSIVFGSPYGIGHKMEAYTTDGKNHEVAAVIAADETDWVRVPAGIMVKARFFISNITPDCNLIRTLDVRGSYRNANGERKDFASKLNNIEVTTVNNSNAENVECTWPFFNIGFNSLSRQKDGRVVLDFTLTNVSGRERSATCDNLRVYDSEGNTYTGKAYYGGQTVGYMGTTFPEDIPVRCRVVIKDVPARIGKLTLIQFDLASGGYSVKVRNQPIAQ